MKGGVGFDPRTKVLHATKLVASLYPFNQFCLFKNINIQAEYPFFAHFMQLQTLQSLKLFWRSVTWQPSKTHFGSAFVFLTTIFTSFF